MVLKWINFLVQLSVVILIAAVVFNETLSDELFRGDARPQLELPAPSVLKIEIGRVETQFQVEPVKRGIRTKLKALFGKFSNLFRHIDISLKRVKGFPATLLQKFRRKRQEVVVESAQIQNDHIECDVASLGLRTDRLEIVNEMFHKLMQNYDSTAEEQARETDFMLSKHLIYRYLVSSNWDSLYNGKR